MTSHHRRLILALFPLAALTLAACSSSSTSTPSSDAGSTSKADGASTLAAVGDDCSTNSMCASGLCDTSLVCVTKAKSLDGGKCTTSADCAKGDACDVASGSCYAPPPATTATKCTTSAQCSSDETCVNGTCQG